MNASEQQRIAAAITEAIEPHVRAFAQQVGELLRAHVQQKLDELGQYAIERLKAELASDAAELAMLEQRWQQAERELTPDPTVAGIVVTSKAQAVELFGAGSGAADAVAYQLDRVAQLPASSVAPPPDSKRVTNASPRCSKCGYIGGNARGCGTPRGHVPLNQAREASSSPSPASESPASDDEDEPAVHAEIVVPRGFEVVQYPGGKGSRPRLRTRRKRTAPRAASIPIKRMTREMLAAEAITEDERNELAAKRPRTRAECRNGPRPCPWVGCEHHLYLDVNPATGSIKINFPDLEPWDLAETCEADVSESGTERTLDEIGGLTNLTRERVRQIEVKGLVLLRPLLEERGIDATALRHFFHPEQGTEQDQ